MTKTDDQILASEKCYYGHPKSIGIEKCVDLIIIGNVPYQMAKEKADIKWYTEDQVRSFILLARASERQIIEKENDKALCGEGICCSAKPGELHKKDCTFMICEHCKMDTRIRNPSGLCDHLYYPLYCKTCIQGSK